MLDRPGARKVAAGAVAIGLIAALALLRRPAADLVLSLAERVEALGWIAPAAYVGLFAAAIPLLVPATPFLLIAGILFGPVLGVFYAFFGNLLGGALSFALARRLVRARVERKLASLTGFAVMTRALRGEGLRGVALVRLSPALPAWLINYALGASRIPWRHYWLSSLAIVPTTALFALSGAGLGDLAALERGETVSHGPGYYVLLAAGIVATIAATVLLGRRAQSIMEDLDDS